MVFGITGDLAKVMTFRSLYRLEQRGLLDCPIVGVAVDDWTVDQLVERARESIVGTGEQLDEEVFRRFAARLSYVPGDFGDAATYERVAEAIGGASLPVFYLEIPPFLFGTGREGARGGRADEDRRASSSRSRSATTCASARALADELHSTSTSRSSSGSTTTSGRWASRRSSTCGSRTRCSSRSGAANYVSSVQITMAEDFGVEDRGHFYDPVGALRDVVVNHLMQVVALCAMEAPARGDPQTIKDAQVALFRAVKEADPAHYVRGQYDGYRSIDGVAPDSTTETYAALRLDIENWRWSGVPFFIRTGKRLPVTQTELRLVFKHPPRLGFPAFERDVEPNQLVVKLDPSTGIRLELEAHRADGPGAIELDMEFADEGGEGADAVRGAAARRAGRREHPLHPPGRRRGDVAGHAAAARRAAAGAPVRAGIVGARSERTSSSPGTAAGTGRGSRR